MSLPHAKQRDQGYIWRGAYTGKNIVTGDHMFFNALKYSGTAWGRLVCFGTTKHFLAHVRSPRKLALRVFPAVNRLTVYRWLLIVEEVVYCRRAYLLGSYWPSAASVIMYGQAAFDRSQLVIARIRCARAKI